jgi:hypothetical protein
VRNLLAWMIAVFLALAVAGSARAIPVLINNGLAPPNPANVFDDATHTDNTLFIRNVGCDELAQVPCASPGAPTTVSLVDGGVVDWLYIMDTSVLEMTGGSVTNNLVGFDTVDYEVSGGSVGGTLAGRGSSTITMSGGSVAGFLSAEFSSTVVLTGGSVGGMLTGEDDGLLLVSGSGFAVDGTPVPYGDLSLETGLLTGTLLSGDPLSNTFRQGEAAGIYTGTIRLIPEPGTAVLLGAGLLGLAAAGRRSR